MFFSEKPHGFVTLVGSRFPDHRLGKLVCKKKCIMVLQGWPQACQRYAVYTPLFGKKWLTMTDVRVHASKVNSLYHEQLIRLSDADLLPGYSNNPGRKIAYMLNCPACTLWEWPACLLCKCWHFCPNCYCRYVVKDCFCRMADVMRCGFVQGPPPGGTLIGLVAKVLIPDDADSLRATRAFVQKRRHLYVDKTKAIGSWISFSAQPAVKARHWELSRRELLIVPGDRIPDPDEMRSLLPSCTYYQKQLEDVKREHLASLVGGVLQYSEGLLLGDYEMVGRILVATHRLRMVSTTGLVYNAPGPDPADEVCANYQ